MTRLLHAPTVDDAARRLDAPAPVLDQATRDLLARTEADAYSRGRQEGARDVAAAAERSAASAIAAVEGAVARVADDLRADAAARADDVVDLARRLAGAILDRELTEGGTALLDRVRAAVDVLDHGPFTVHLAEVDAAVLDGHEPSLPVGTTVAVDPRLAPGEARVTGPWSGADLTRDAMLDALLESGA